MASALTLLQKAHSVLQDAELRTIRMKEAQSQLERVNLRTGAVFAEELAKLASAGNGGNCWVQLAGMSDTVDTIEDFTSFMQILHKLAITPVHFVSFRTSAISAIRSWVGHSAYACANQIYQTSDPENNFEAAQALVVIVPYLNLIPDEMLNQECRVIKIRSDQIAKDWIGKGFFPQQPIIDERWHLYIHLAQGNYERDIQKRELVEEIREIVTRLTLNPPPEERQQLESRIEELRNAVAAHGQKVVSLDQIIHGIEGEFVGAKELLSLPIEETCNLSYLSGMATFFELITARYESNLQQAPDMVTTDIQRVVHKVGELGACIWNRQPDYQPAIMEMIHGLQQYIHHTGCMVQLNRVYIERGRLEITETQLDCDAMWESIAWCVEQLERAHREEIPVHAGQMYAEQFRSIIDDYMGIQLLDQNLLDYLKEIHVIILKLVNQESDVKVKLQNIGNVVDQLIKNIRIHLDPILQASSDGQATEEQVAWCNVHQLLLTQLNALHDEVLTAKDPYLYLVFQIQSQLHEWGDDSSPLAEVYKIILNSISSTNILLTRIDPESEYAKSLRGLVCSKLIESLRQGLERKGGEELISALSRLGI